MQVGAQEAHVHEGVGYIPLRGTGRRGYVRVEETRVIGWVKVDPEDLPALAAHRWHVTSSGYAHRWIGGRPPKRKGESMHRRILGLVAGDRRQVDHVNRDKLDNRRCNLRIVANDAENHQNMPGRGGSSRHRGVYFDRSRDKWVAQHKCGGKRLHRRFDTEVEAERVARAWRREHMPFAVD